MYVRLFWCYYFCTIDFHHGYHLWWNSDKDRMVVVIYINPFGDTNLDWLPAYRWVVQVKMASHKPRIWYHGDTSHTYERCICTVTLSPYSVLHIGLTSVLVNTVDDFTLMTQLVSYVPRFHRLPTLELYIHLPGKYGVDTKSPSHPNESSMYKVRWPETDARNSMWRHEPYVYINQ